MFRALTLSLIALALAACGSAPPRVPPTELTSINQIVPIEVLWSRSVDDTGRGRFEPLLGATTVTVADRTGRVVRYERDTGKTVWSRDLDRGIASGVGGDDSLILVAGADGLVLALDANDGSERWSTRVSSEVLTPAVAAFGTVIVRSADGRLVRLNSEDGSEQWSSSWTPPALTVVGYGRPLVVDGGVLVGLDDGRVLALNSANGRTIWEAVVSRPAGRSEVERMVDVDADITVDGEQIYVVNFQGRAARLEPSRGGTDWSVPMSSTDGLAVGDQLLVVVDADGELHALDKRSGTTRWTQAALRGRSPSAPAVFDDMIVVGDFEGVLHLLDLDTGEFIGRRNLTDGAISARPLGDRDGVLVQSEQGEVRALRLAPAAR